MFIEWALPIIVYTASQTSGNRNDQNISHDSDAWNVEMATTPPVKYMD